MSGPIKVFLVIIVFIVFTFTTVGISGANNNAEEAKDYLNIITSEISMSNFNDEVIEKLIEEAGSNGYTLTVKTVGEDEFGYPQYAVCELTFIYYIPVLEFSQTHTATSIAK